MAKIKEREKAISLRKSGKSIAEIAELLKVSKSTVSVWCRDVKLTEVAIKKIVLASNKKSTEGILRYTEMLREKRQIAVSKAEKVGAQKLGRLSSRDIFCIGLGLYWGEGYKQGSQEFGFTNSDPQMIKFYLLWLKETFDVKSEDLILRVSINSLHARRLAEVVSFWSNVTNVPLEQFTKTSLLKTKSKKVYSNQSNHFGTLRVKVRRGTDMRRQVMGAIKSIEN